MVQARGEFVKYTLERFNHVNYYEQLSLPLAQALAFYNAPEPLYLYLTIPIRTCEIDKGESLCPIYSGFDVFKVITKMKTREQI